MYEWESEKMRKRMNDKTENYNKHKKWENDKSGKWDHSIMRYW